MRVLLFLLLGTLTACAARQAHPVKISQPNDPKLTCSEIEAERAANLETAIELAGTDKATEVRNVFAAVIFVGAVDISQVEQIEMRALYDRNKTLERLAKGKTC